IIEGITPASTAEQLMRSRYTAFTLGNADYLMKSWHSKTRNLKEKVAIRHWAKSVRWMKLEIISKSNGAQTDTQGFVKFRAVYFENGRVAQILENSYFEKENNLWVYVSGEHE
ncbi:MAG: YchJ family protein, partial [Bacteroidales bacterium]